jgi:hypothetical protein
MPLKSVLPSGVRPVAAGACAGLAETLSARYVVAIEPTTIPMTAAAIVESLNQCRMPISFSDLDLRAPASETNVPRAFT